MKTPQQEEEHSESSGGGGVPSLKPLDDPLQRDDDPDLGPGPRAGGPS